MHPKLTYERRASGITLDSYNVNNAICLSEDVVRGNESRQEETACSLSFRSLVVQDLAAYSNTKTSGLVFSYKLDVIRSIHLSSLLCSALWGEDMLHGNKTRNHRPIRHRHTCDSHKLLAGFDWAVAT